MITLDQIRKAQDLMGEKPAQESNRVISLDGINFFNLPKERQEFQKYLNNNPELKEFLEKSL